MNSLRKPFSISFLSQLGIYLVVNSLFILKYLSRYSNYSLIVLVVYVLSITAAFFTFNKANKRINESFWKYAGFILTGIIIILITLLLIKIDRYSVRVDRWSAVTFFLDSLFKGEYPYAAHTHVCDTNFASPFPVWHLINIPFYLLGDVGYGLIFFLLLTYYSLLRYTNSHRYPFIFVALLFLSPAYWWEVSVRSDSLSNALLVFNTILYYNAKKCSLNKNLGFSIIVCGLIASTRLSAILPLALYFFSDYIRLPLKKATLFPLGILGIMFIMFSPFIFWDTHGWIFFHRNPFMSQTSIGNSYVLILMMAVGVFISLRIKHQRSFFILTSSFMFLFILFSQIGLVLTRGIVTSFFEDSTYDISYFTLAFPYTLMVLSSESFFKKNQSLTSSI